MRHTLYHQSIASATGRGKTHVTCLKPRNPRVPIGHHRWTGRRSLNHCLRSITKHKGRRLPDPCLPKMDSEAFVTRNSSTALCSQSSSHENEYNCPKCKNQGQNAKGRKRRNSWRSRNLLSLWEDLHSYIVDDVPIPPEPGCSREPEVATI